jgi:ABC-type transport system involved in multi-copper enzyme maturation permease subunit
MSVIARILPDNPVLTKELRVRMRGGRAYWILFGYLGFLSLVLLVNYASWLSRVQGTGVGGSEAGRLGTEIFTYVIITQVFLVLFITPAITSGSLTIEREQQTMDMLTMTRLSRRHIITGKLLSAVSFTALLLISSLPLVSICFMLGSVDPAMVFSYYMMMLMGSFLVGAMGLMFSSIARTTTQAVMYTYGALFVLFIVGVIPFGANQSPFFGGSLAENMSRAVGAVWFGNRFLGIPGPEGIGFALLCALAGILMAAIATTRLETYPERRGWLLRGLTLAFLLFQMLALNLWWLDAWYNRGAKAVQAQVQPPIAVLCLTAILLAVLIPTFATGELAPGEARRFGSYMAWGWTPKGLKQNKLASGLPFLLLTTLFCLALYMISFVFMGKPKDIAHSGGAALNLPAANTQTLPPYTTVRTVNGQTVATTTLPNGVVTSITTTGPNGQTSVVTRGPNGTIYSTTTMSSNPYPWAVSGGAMPASYAAKAGDFPQAAIMLLAFTIGFSLLCLLLTIALRNRWVAWLVANVILIALCLAPSIALGSIYQNEPPGPAIHLWSFNPIHALYQMSDPTNYWASYHNAPFAGQAMWQATTISWLATGVVSLLLTLALVAREKRRTAAIPYEEMANPS